MGKIVKVYLPAVVFGLIFGIANIIPGVSGGTMLVVCGCFGKVCGALALDFKEIKKNWVFLVFFGIGAVIGIVGFSFVITYLFENFPLPTNTFFMGLIIGGVPLIVRSAKNAGKIAPMHILPFVLAFAGVITLSVLSKTFVSSATDGNVSMILLFFSGIIGAVAMIIPGVSGSFVLVLIGVYPVIIQAITEFNLWVLIPTGLGILIGLVFGARGIQILMRKFPVMVFSAVLGMVLASLYAIFPSGVGLNLQTLVGATTLLAGMFVAYIIGRYNSKSDGQ